MKNTKPHRSSLAKLIAVQAALIAIFTQPWLVSFFSDIVAIATGQTDLSLRDQIINGLSVLSTAGLVVAVVAAIWLLLTSKK